MISKKLIGLYITGDLLQYVCVKKTPLGISPCSLAPGQGPYGEIQGGGPASLREFLKMIPLDTRPDIFLALPRGLFFMRDLSLPPMMPEEALDSIKNSLGLYCHLPEEDIYYDVRFCRDTNDGTRAMLIYAARKEIDKFLDVFEEAGARGLLKGLFPLSYGVFAWMEAQGHRFPVAVRLPVQEGIHEIAVLKRRCFLYSAAVRAEQDLGVVEHLALAVREKFPEIGGSLISIPDLDSTSQGRNPKGLFSGLPHISENLALAALAHGLAQSQPLRLDGTQAKMRRLRPAMVLVPLSILFFLILSFVTWTAYKEVSLKQGELEVQEARIQLLNKEIGPLAHDLEVLKRTRTLAQDIQDYLASRPRLFSIVNRIAELSPGGTWFSSFVYEKGTITMLGNSDDAMKAVEALRKCEHFSQVKLVGSVNRRADGKERFRVKITLAAPAEHEAKN